MTSSRSTAAKARLGIALALAAAVVGVGVPASGAYAAPGAVAATTTAAKADPCDRNLANFAQKQRRSGSCAEGPQAELIWQGRVHLGDEPGIYGDASFAGGAVELPITLQRTSATGPDKTVLAVEAQDVQSFSGYPGHAVTVVLHVVDQTTFRAKEVVLAKTRLTGNRKEIPIDLTGRKSPYFVSVQVRQDEEVPPGAQDDFLLTRLSNLSEGFRFFANFGYNVSPYSD
ncbi:hypothetical protein [Streptosporangium carneum]|uniref:Uncharacterized protein n=1 Tax=Streptosporangium carneum TaxID=47481 RepID=A0A9W6I6L7_9ACTN|nr:hypothetical protein [Streptosporangium carneum]GLK12366.1 hypothetical protein GCM10017600_57760 [Streptosporangium carneum]